jgi:hypothetical protein
VGFGSSLDQTHSRTETTIKMLRVFFLTGVYRTLDVLDERVKLVLFPLDEADEADADEDPRKPKGRDDMTGYDVQADELRDTLLRYIQMLRKEVLLTTAVEEFEGADRISTDDVAHMLMRRTKALVRTVQTHLHSIPEGIVFVAAQHAARAPGKEQRTQGVTGGSLALHKRIAEHDWDDDESAAIADEIRLDHARLDAKSDVKGTHIPEIHRGGRVKYEDDGSIGEVTPLTTHSLDLKHRSSSARRR